MGAEDNELTLEELAQRLEALERENDALRNEVTKLRGSETPRAGERASECDGQVSRRQVLSKAGAAAVGVVVAGALVLRNPRDAKADHTLHDGISVDHVHTHWVDADTDDGGWAVKGTTSGDRGEAALEGVNAAGSSGAARRS